MDIAKMTAVELGRKIKSREISVSEAVEAVFDRIKSAEGEYNCYVTLCEEQALKKAEEIQKKTDQEVRITVPGHTQRGGSPCPYDRVLATRLGAAAAELILKEEYGYMVGMKKGETVKVPLSEVAGKLKMVDPDSKIIKEAKLTGISFGDK